MTFFFKCVDVNVESENKINKYWIHLSRHMAVFCFPIFYSNSHKNVPLECVEILYEGSAVLEKCQLHDKTLVTRLNLIWYIIGQLKKKASRDALSVLCLSGSQTKSRLYPSSPKLPQTPFHCPRLCQHQQTWQTATELTQHTCHHYPPENHLLKTITSDCN